MKKITYLLSVMIISMTFNLQAQNVTPMCGHDYVLQSMEQKYPGYNQAIRRTFKDAKERGASLSRTGQVYTIPVVVHVVWKAEVENISDERINEQIAVLNENYRRTNADADNVRAEFADIVGDAEIQFELAKIIRVQTTTNFQIDLFGGSLVDVVKHSSQGGSDAWDTEHYLNIWVTKIPTIPFLGQIYGYAYPPADLAHWPEGQASTPEVDGVVIHHEIFGRNTTSNGYDFQGVITVHEVGHYLGLRHIWADGGGLFGSPGCDVDDGVEDTPNAAVQSQFDCDQTRNSCVDTPIDLPDMVENFMDYAGDACMNSFTYGQIDIMRGSLEGPRSGLIESSVSTKNLTTVVENMTASPNPSTGLINLRFINSEQLDYTIQVRNILGQQVAPIIQENAFHANYNLDLLNQPSGIYFIELTANGQKMTTKIVLMD